MKKIILLTGILLYAFCAFENFACAEEKVIVSSGGKISATTGQQNPQVWNNAVDYRVIIASETFVKGLHKLQMILERTEDGQPLIYPLETTDTPGIAKHPIDMPSENEIKKFNNPTPKYMLNIVCLSAGPANKKKYEPWGYRKQSIPKIDNEVNLISVDKAINAEKFIDILKKDSKNTAFTLLFKNSFMIEPGIKKKISVKSEDALEEISMTALPLVKNDNDIYLKLDIDRIEVGLVKKMRTVPGAVLLADNFKEGKIKILGGYDFFDIEASKTPEEFRGKILEVYEKFCKATTDSGLKFRKKTKEYAYKDIDVQEVCKILDEHVRREYDHFYYNKLWKQDTICAVMISKIE